MLSDADYWKLIAIWVIVIIGFVSIILLVYLNHPNIKLPTTIQSKMFWVIEMVSLLLTLILILGAILSCFNII